MSPKSHPLLGTTGGTWVHVGDRLQGDGRIAQIGTSRKRRMLGPDPGVDDSYHHTGAGEPAIPSAVAIVETEEVG